MSDVPSHLFALSASSDPGEEYCPMPQEYERGRTKYIIITGSVMSGLGKGIFSSGLARLLEDCGLRTNLIKMTARGRRLVEKVEPLYAARVKKIMSSFSEAEQKRLIGALERIRRDIAD